MVRQTGDPTGCSVILFKDQLDGARAKIERSERQVDELKIALREWVAAIGNPATIRSVEHKTDWKQITGTLAGIKPPVECSVILGDCVHNLRSALDHLVAAMAPAYEYTTQFPVFWNDTPETRKTIKKRLKHVFPPGAALVKDLQPYHRRPEDPRSDPLWVLSELDNIDKHRLLLVVNPKLADGQIRFRVGGKVHEVTLSKSPDWNPMALGAVPFRITLNGPEANDEVQVDASATTAVVFAKTGLKCDGAEIFPTLRDLISEVRLIFDDFDNRFFELYEG